jgi:hypothetical protein
VGDAEVEVVELGSAKIGWTLGIIFADGNICPKLDGQLDGHLES